MMGNAPEENGVSFSTGLFLKNQIAPFILLASVPSNHSLFLFFLRSELLSAGAVDICPETLPFSVCETNRGQGG